MKEDIFDEQLEAAIQRLEKLWQRTDALPHQPREEWQRFDELATQSEEVLLLQESLQELSNSLEELHAALEELREKNEELAASRISAEAERQRYQELFDFSPDAYLVTDVMGVIEEANQAAASMLNIRSDRLVGKPLTLYVSKSVRDGFFTQLFQLQSGETARDWEIEIKPRNGKPFPAICTVVPVQNQGKRVIGLRWQLRNITRRKQAEQVEQKLKMLDAILYASPVNLHVIDQTGKYLYVSPEAARTLGKAQTDIVGKSWRELGFPPQFMESFDAQRQEVLATGQPITEEASFPVPDGVKDCEYTISPMFNGESSVDAVVVTVRDITKHKQAEAEIKKVLMKQKELNQMKARFISVISHEVRNPLTNIFASAELLANYAHKWDGERKNRQLQRIQAGVKQVNDLFNDLLLVSKAEAGKLRIKPSLLELDTFCRQLIEQMQSGVGRKHTITFSIKGKHTGACLDEKLLSSILTNILLNAIKYSPEGSNIQFDLNCEGSEAIFRIQDAGIGIPAKDRAKLFNSFERGSNVGNIEGIGLGLSIVKQCVDLHGGNIIVESEESVGTTVTVTLPLHQRRSQSVS